MSEDDIKLCPACGALPCDWTNNPHDDPVLVRQVISRIAEVAAAIGWQAGVGAMETAGSIVSYLAAHPEELPKLMDGSLSVIDWPDRWHIHGVLTWQNAEGKVFTPEFARRHLAIKAMEQSK